MSTTSIICKVSLSKKLRLLLNTGIITLTADINNGKGIGRLLITSEVDIDKDIDVKKMGETSIMLVPIEISDEEPNNGTKMVSNIFSSIPTKKEQSNEPFVKKIASVNPPEDGEKILEDVKLPATFGQLNDPECQNYIKNLEGLIEAVNIAKHKKAEEIDVDKITNPRIKAVEIEKKELAEAIDVPAWIVLNSEAAGSIAINDLDIRLKENIPFNLGRISAKKIAASGDLRALLHAGYIKFITPDEVKKYAEKTTEDVDSTHPSLEVFGNHEEAMDAINDENHISKAERMDLTERDITSTTEEEDMITNLTQNMAITKSKVISNSNGVKKSVHGNISQSPSAVPKNPTIKTITRKE